MGYILYTPTRSLIGGSDGKLHPDFQRFHPAHEDKVTQQESLDGSNVETTYIGRVKYYDLLTPPIEQSLWDKYEEFWHSVAGGESFTLDAYGTEASPDNPLTVKLVPKTWKPSELGPLHNLYTFRIRVV